MLRAIYKIAIFGFGIAVVGAVFGVGLIAYLSFDLPKIKDIGDYRPAIPSQILTQDGQLLLEVGKERRYLASFDEIPKKIINAMVAAEDNNFFEHNGVEYLGILRALKANIRAGRIVQGGSTITQQLAKALLRDRSKSVIRKLKDLLLARKIESKLSKEEILYLYLNEEYFGGGYYGIKAAIRGYFGKELSEATLAESALIAGLLVAPGRYSPYLNPVYAKKRQGYVLKRMLETNKISSAEYEEAINEVIKLRIKQSTTNVAGYFTDWIRQRVIALVGEDQFLRGGFKIVTSLDWDMQLAAEKEVIEGVKELDKRKGFKGPIKVLVNDQEIKAFELKFRKEEFENHSNFFQLTLDGTKQHEFEFVLSDFEKIKSSMELAQDEAASEYFVPGVAINDALVNLLEVDKNYEAVVIHVNNPQRAVYVSLGGAVGIIPYENFRWAHRRQVTEDRVYSEQVTSPSQILKKGDVVLVKINQRPTGIWSKLYLGFRNSLKEGDLKKKILQQKMFVCDLDQEPEVQSSLLSLQPRTGRILAFVGGNDFSKTQFNRVTQSVRQLGSTFKPLLFAAALEEGFKPNDIIIDSPEALAGVDDTLNWKPRNYDGIFKGPITFRQVLVESRNVPTIKIGETIGIPKLISFLNRMNVNTDGINPDLSIVLGSMGMTLIDLVSIYSVFPNEGKRVIPQSIISITDRYGNVIENLDEKVAVTTPLPTDDESDENEEGNKVAENSEIANSTQNKINPYLKFSSPDQVYDPRLAYIMTNLLKGVIHGPHGTGGSAKNLGSYIGGKTGTTSNYVDAWFVGFSPKVVTGVWTGFDENKTLGWGESGARAALPIWRGYMKSALAKYGETDFRAPRGIINVLIDGKTGKLAEGSNSDAFMEAFVLGTEPGRDEVVETIEKEDLESNDTFLEDDEYYSSQ